MDIKRIVNESDTFAGRFFDLSIQCLIIYSLITFSISTISELSDGILIFLYYSQIVTVTLFTIEYFLRIYSAAKMRSYIFSFYGIVDLLAILPFYLATSIDLRAIRILRLIRLFRLLKIARYSKAIQRFRFVLSDIKAELTIFFPLPYYLFI